MPLALASSDIFLFPSWYEAFSLATIEAAACGLPVVATSINGTEDFIQPGVNGDFVESDPKHIAKVIEPLIQDSGKRQEMGRNARQLVEKNYTWDRVTEQTENAYKEYLGSQSKELKMHLLVVSHPCTTPINQQIYAELEQQTGWKISLIIPDQWKDEFGNTLEGGFGPACRRASKRCRSGKTGTSFFTSYKRNWTSFFKRNQFDAIYVHNEPYAMAAAQICWANARTLKAPFGFYSAQNILKQYPPPFSWLESMVYRKSAYAFPITEAVEEVLLAKKFRGRSEVCALPLDPEIYRPRGLEEDHKLIPGPTTRWSSVMSGESSSQRACVRWPRRCPSCAI